MNRLGLKVIPLQISAVAPCIALKLSGELMWVPNSTRSLLYKGQSITDNSLIFSKFRGQTLFFLKKLRDTKVCKSRFVDIMKTTRKTQAIVMTKLHDVTYQMI